MVRLSHSSLPPSLPPSSLPPSYPALSLSKSLEKGWQLLSIALAFFPPTIIFRSYLEGFLWRHVEPLAANRGVQLLCSGVVLITVFLVRLLLYTILGFVVVLLPFVIHICCYPVVITCLLLPLLLYVFVLPLLL